jgi:molybdate transport system regulatory protein
MQKNNHTTQEKPLAPQAGISDKVQLHFKIWMSTGEGKGIMGDGKWQILKAIEQYGSLRSATQALDLTYRRTWGDLKAIEQELGFPLIKKTRGGLAGGKSCLTPQGVKLVAAFDRLHATTDSVMERAFQDFHRDLQDI